MILGHVDEDVVSVVSLLSLRGAVDITGREVSGGSDKLVVAVAALVVLDVSDTSHGLLGLVDEDVVGTSLVVGRGLVIVGSGVVFVAGLELMALSLGGLNGGLLRGVHATHELAHGGGGDQSTDGTDLLNQTGDGAGILAGSGIDTGLSLGDDESPNGNGKVAERLLVSIRLNIVGGAESVALTTELRRVDTLGVHEVAESHEADGTDTEHHDGLGEAVKAFLVMIDLALVLLDVLEELDRVLW